jgi:hypothetical protein
VSRACTLARTGSELHVLVGHEELLANPAQDVVDDRLGGANVETRGFEAHVGQHETMPWANLPSSSRFTEFCARPVRRRLK